MCTVSRAYKVQLSLPNLLYSKINGLIKVDVQIGEKGQLYLYFGQDLNNRMMINIDPAGINFRSTVNGVTKKMWDIYHD